MTGTGERNTSSNGSLDGPLENVIYQVPRLDEEVEPVEWVVQGMIPRQAVTFISGVSGKGKTWVAMALSDCIAHGKPFCEMPVVQSPVLYLDRENNRATVFDRSRKLNWSGYEDIIYLGRWVRLPGLDEVPGPGSDEIRNWLKSEVSQGRKPVLIFDTWIAFYEFGEETQMNDRKMGERYRRLCDLSATVVVLLHSSEKTKTAKSYRGNTELKAGVDMAYLVESYETEGRLDRINVQPWKSRIAPGVFVKARLVDGRGIDGQTVPSEKDLWDAKDKGPVNPKAVIAQIVLDEPGLNQSQIVERAQKQGIGDKKARSILQELEDEGAIKAEAGKNNAKLYFTSALDALGTGPVV